jgi:hypothetical protein
LVVRSALLKTRRQLHSMNSKKTDLVLVYRLAAGNVNGYRPHPLHQPDHQRRQRNLVAGPDSRSTKLVHADADTIAALKTIRAAQRVAASRIKPHYVKPEAFRRSIHAAWLCRCLACVPCERTRAGKCARVLIRKNPHEPGNGGLASSSHRVASDTSFPVNQAGG